MDDWDGKDRRASMFNKDFYDKMMEMHSNLKHMVTWSENHDEQDNERFREANKKVDMVTKVAYMGIGGLAVLQVVISFLK